MYARVELCLYHTRFLLRLYFEKTFAACFMIPAIMEFAEQKKFAKNLQSGFLL